MASYTLSVRFSKAQPWTNYWKLEVPGTNNKISLRYFTTAGNTCFTESIEIENS